MGDVTKIEWADRTFNPWIGCAKISPACDHCYADALMGTAGRYGRATWGGPGKGDGTRTRTSEANWKKPLKWNREAASAPGETFVFCASLADVFDNAVPEAWRRDLFELIRATPNLTWLLLTKRPGNILGLSCAAMTLDERFPPNIALGCTIANQEEADRDIPKLLAAKAALKPAFAFLSMEPLLGPVDLTNLDCGARRAGAHGWSAIWKDNGLGREWIDFVIVGGESGPDARPMDLDWVRPIRDACARYGVVFNFKQRGGRTADKGGHYLDGRAHLDRPRIAA